MVGSGARWRSQARRRRGWWSALLVTVSFFVLGASAGGASASASAWVRRAGRLPVSRQGADSSLARTPAALRVAVLRRLSAGQRGVRAPAASAAALAQEGKLAAGDGVAANALGSAVTVSGGTAIVGAPGRNGGAGTAYLFTRAGAVWSERAELNDPAGAAGDRFGAAVAIDGTTAVIGAPGTVSGGYATGAAYVFVGWGSKWSQLTELTASDGAAGDQFGAAVALSGPTAVIGAPDRNGSTGAAYVFTGEQAASSASALSGGAWEQEAALSASDGVAGDEFGAAVAVSGASAVIGAPHRDAQDGAAYVFAGSRSGWAQRAELGHPGAAAGDQFGAAVAVSGATAVVGAPETVVGGVYTGAAYVFGASGSTWSSRATLNDPTPVCGFFPTCAIEFGAAVAVSGTRALVGAPGETTQYLPPGGAPSGAAYLFSAASGWSQDAQLVASDGVNGDEFGAAVAMSGATAVIGAPGANNSAGTAYPFGTATPAGLTEAAGLTAPGVTGYETVAVSGSTAVVGAYVERGAAYVYTRSWSTSSGPVALSDPGNPTTDDFGSSVAVCGETVMVGAPGADGSEGVVYVFTRAASGWSEQAALTDPGARGGDQFGGSLAISGRTAVIGAPGSGSGAGDAYVYALTGSGWTQRAELTDPAADPGDSFGSSVALSGTTALIGAPRTDSSTGAAYVFHRTRAAWSEQAALTASDPAADHEFGYAVALAGTTAVIGAPGGLPITDLPGSAYVFRPSASGWSQQDELTGFDLEAFGTFGDSVAVSGQTIVIGSAYADWSSGAVYVFTESGAGVTPRALIMDPVGYFSSADGFGVAVAMSDANVVIAKPSTSGPNGPNWAYVYSIG